MHDTMADSFSAFAVLLKNRNNIHILFAVVAFFLNQSIPADAAATGSFWSDSTFLAPLSFF